MEEVFAFWSLLLPSAGGCEGVVKWDRVKLGQLTCRRWDSECWGSTCPGCPSLSVPVSGSHKGHTGVQS